VNSAAKGEVKTIRVHQPNKGDVYKIPTGKNKKVMDKTYQPISTTAKRNTKKECNQAILNFGSNSQNPTGLIFDL
jgi:hypothetical protein